MKEDITVYIKKCEICAANKKPSKAPKAPLGTIKVGAPWDVIAIDYLGPLPLTERGHRYVLVLTDLFTKYVEILPVRDQTAEECARQILNNFIARWGCPLGIHSDQGRTFESEVFRQLTKMLEIRKTRTTARNPKCNGQCERFNRTLLGMIKSYLVGEQRDWDLYLGCLAGAYRATPNESTTLTPNLMTLGREIRLPAELVFGSQTTSETEVCSYGDYVDKLRNRMQSAHDIARKHLGCKSKRRKEVHDVKLAHKNYSEGDVVWLLRESRKVGIAQKLERSYDGPFLLKKRLNDINFLVQLDRSGSDKVVHHDKLKPFEGREIPNWIKKARDKLPNRNKQGSC